MLITCVRGGCLNLESLSAKNMPSSFNSDAFSRAGPAVGAINVIVMKLFQKKYPALLNSRRMNPCTTVAGRSGSFFMPTAIKLV
jgi:hypothetical protein